jgi:hypothetical protein
MQKAARNCAGRGGRGRGVSVGHFKLVMEDHKFTTTNRFTKDGKMQSATLISPTLTNTEQG